MRISDWSSDVCSSDLLAVDRFALRHVIGAAVDREIHVARRDEVHFDACVDIVPHRAVAEILDRYIAAELAIDPFEQIEVERRGHAGRILIGGFEHAAVLDPVDAGQQPRPVDERAVPDRWGERLEGPEMTSLCKY